MLNPSTFLRKCDVCKTRSFATFGAISFCALQSIFILTIWLTVSTVSAQEERTDRIVFFSIPIDVDVAPLCASPSPSSYRTGIMRKGQRVEVYFCDENGFCAIRPPQGSFSWVNARFIELETSSTGHVVSNAGKAIPSRVGGESPANSTVVQVGLQNGQKVKIIEKYSSGDGVEWYKIAPPSGEFRWIDKDYLINDPALDLLPSKPTPQSDYLAQLQAKESDSSNADVGGDVESEELTMTLLDLPEDAERNTEPKASQPQYDVKSFKIEVARLNSDVFQALQQKTTSNEDIELLALRAEQLFDGAPNDDERFYIQSIYDVVKKAQKDRANQANIERPIPYVGPGNNQSYPNPVTTPNVDAARFAPGNQQQAPINAIPQPMGNQPFFGQGAYFDPALNGWVIPGDMNAPQNQQVWNAPNFNVQSGLVGAPNAQISEGSPTSKRRLEFAFSGSNAPFRAKNAGTSPAPSMFSRMKPSLAHLPSASRSTGSLIVPPSSYNYVSGGMFANAGVKTKTRLSDAIVVNQNKSNDANKIALVPEQSQRRRSVQGGLVFQEPEVALANARPNATVAPDRNSATISQTNWSDLVKSSGSNGVVQTSSVASAATQAKIRQTNSFAPIAVGSSQNFDAAGMLVSIADSPQGAPQYALFEKSGDAFKIVAYLEAQKNVDLSKFVGRQIGVKGDLGTITIEGAAQKLVVVGSVFPQ